MRLNVRVMIEKGIRETGSFKKALDRLPDNVTDRAVRQLLEV